MMTLGLPFSWATVVLVGALLVLLAIVSGRDQRSEAMLRFGASLLLLLPLIGLGVWRSMTPSSQSSASLMIAADRSRSMSVRDVGTDDPLGGPTRVEAASSNWLDGDALERLREAALVEARTLGDGSRRPIALPDRDSSADGLESLLVSDLTRLIDEASASGSSDILVLSDGIDTEGQSFDAPAEVASALGVRVHTVPVGRSLSGGDTAVVLTAMADRLIAGESTSLMAQVRGPDDAPAARLVVRETRYADRSRGAEASERVVFERLVNFDQPDRRRIEIPIRPSPDREDGTVGGLELFEYTARLEPMDGEQRTDNNEARAIVRLTDAPIRVLVIEGEPYWDTRFLVAALRLDEDLELVTAQAVGQNRLLVRWMPAGPVQLDPETRLIDLIGESDIVILGRGVDRLIVQADAERLRDFVVERGGGLVMLRGRPTTHPGLAPIFDGLAPVDWADRTLIEQSRASLTEAGRASGLFEPRDLAEDEFQTEFDLDTGTIVSTLPDLASVTRVERERSLSVVLLRRQEDASALIIHSRTGSGRVLAVLGEGLWRWAIRPPDAFASADAEAVYSALWRRTTRWLVGREAFLPGEDLSVRLTTRTIRPGDLARIEIRARSGDAEDTRTPTLTVYGPGNTARIIEVRSVTDEPSARIGFGERGWSSVFEPDTPGVYRIVASWADGDGDGQEGFDLLVVQEDRGELRDVSTRRAELEALSAATGGLVLPLSPSNADIERLLDLVRGEIDEGAPEPARRFEPIWDSPGIFLILAFVLILAWWLNRRWSDA